jgi:hypothetical protein
MPQTSYRLWYYRTGTGGRITEAAVTFHEGSEVPDTNPDGSQTMRYVPTGRLEVPDPAHVAGLSVAADASGTPHYLYRAPEFEDLETVDDLHTFLESRLALDVGRDRAATPHRGGRPS